jgi:hypothetical protein
LRDQIAQELTEPETGGWREISSKYEYLARPKSVDYALRFEFFAGD